MCPPLNLWGFELTCNQQNVAEVMLLRTPVEPAGPPKSNYSEARMPRGSPGHTQKQGICASDHRPPAQVLARINQPESTPVL